MTGTTKRLKLLVVDDEPGMRLGVERALRRYNFDVDDIDLPVAMDIFLAETGEEALELIEQEKPDLMLLDHKLPGISGLDVLGRLNGSGKDMLTVMMTAYASLETAVTATKRGAHDYLAKPFTPNELKAVVSTAAKHLLLKRRAKQLAEEKRRVRFEFVSVLAHELKAPLGAIEGYLHLIKDRTKGDEVQEYDGFLDRSLHRLDGMRKLIFDLLDMTRIESGEKVRHFTDINVVELVKGTVETLEPLAGEKSVSIRVDAPDSLVIPADGGELEILFNNLISNAVKYNRPDGSVKVTIKIEKDTFCFDVEDTGIGMTAEEAASLFKEFRRIKNKKTRGIPGSGLGLSTVRKLCELYGGNVSVTSEPDVGSHFSIRLPLGGQDEQK